MAHRHGHRKVEAVNDRHLYFKMRSYFELEALLKPKALSIEKMKNEKFLFPHILKEKPRLWHIEAIQCVRARVTPPPQWWVCEALIAPSRPR